MRERSIVSAMGQGMTSKEIARLLGLSHRTVETYRQRLMTKTGAKNASQLLAMLH
jgi:DNA-binding CsgD family transcriptional regulator